MPDKKTIQKVVLGAAIFNSDLKFLILRRHEDEDIFPGMWELPSGKKEDLEKAEAALLREIEEEAGCDVDIVMPFSVFNYQIEKPEEIRDTTQINFLARLKNGQEVKISSEHQESKWIGKEVLGDYGMSDATKDVLKKAFDILDKFNIK